MIFEEIAGLVRMTIDKVDGLVAGASLAAPQPFRILRDSMSRRSRKRARSSRPISTCAGIALPARGAPFVIAEVRDRDALRRAQQRMECSCRACPETR